MMCWFFPDGASRQAGLERYFATIFARQYVRHGVCEHTEAAAAFWVPPEAKGNAVPDAQTIHDLLNILGDRAPVFRDAVETAGEHTPQEPHWYLAVIGADPAAQGQGHGAALLRSGLAKADAAGMPAYLESSKPENIPFYQYFGFTVREEVRLPGGGPVLRGMWREPRSAADA